MSLQLGYQQEIIRVRTIILKHFRRGQPNILLPCLIQANQHVKILLKITRLKHEAKYGLCLV